MEQEFPSRKSLRKSYRSSIVSSVKEIDVSDVDYSTYTEDDFKPRNQIVEKQKVYFWIRLYLKEEMDISPNTELKITYFESGESLNVKFVCYAKKGHEKDQDPNIAKYNNEDDKKVLCLMIDSDDLDKNSNNIPFIRTLFKTSRYYKPQRLRLVDLPISMPDGTLIE